MLNYIFFPSILFMCLKTKTALSPHIKEPFITWFTFYWSHVSLWCLPASCILQTETINALKVWFTTKGGCKSSVVSTVRWWHFLYNLSSLQTWCIMVCFVAASWYSRRFHENYITKALEQTKAFFPFLAMIIMMSLLTKLSPTKLFYSPYNEKHTFLELL